MTVLVFDCSCFRFLLLSWTWLCYFCNWWYWWGAVVLLLHLVLYIWFCFSVQFWYLYYFFFLFFLACPMIFLNLHRDLFLLQRIDLLRIFSIIILILSSCLFCACSCDWTTGSFRQLILRFCWVRERAEATGRVGCPLRFFWFLSERGVTFGIVDNTGAFEIDFFFVFAFGYGEYLTKGLWFEFFDVTILWLFFVSADVGVHLAESLT